MASSSPIQYKSHPSLRAPSFHNPRSHDHSCLDGVSCSNLAPSYSLTAACGPPAGAFLLRTRPHLFSTSLRSLTRLGSGRHISDWLHELFWTQGPDFCPKGLLNPSLREQKQRSIFSHL